jgi:hypothetical protein
VKVSIALILPDRLCGRTFGYFSILESRILGHEVIINLIAGTTTRIGLKVHAELDDSLYPAGIKVSDDEFKQIHLTRNTFHGEWNYRIDPRSIVD